MFEYLTIAASRYGFEDIATSLQPVSNVRDAVRNTPGVIGVAGDGALGLDYQNAVFGNFPLMFAVIAVLTIALLTRAFRSIVLAIKAVLVNLISMAAAFGAMTWFWQQGHGSSLLFGIPATGAITFWIPLMVFAFLFGLSTDYEVFACKGQLPAAIHEPRLASEVHMNPREQSVEYHDGDVELRGYLVSDDTATNVPECWSYTAAPALTNTPERERDKSPSPGWSSSPATCTARA